MNTANNIPNETSTWQQPGAWRKPCIVHVTMVAKGREPIFGNLTYNGTRAEVEKTAKVGSKYVTHLNLRFRNCPLFYRHYIAVKYHKISVFPYFDAAFSGF